MKMMRWIMKRWLKRQKAVYEQPLPPPSEKQPLSIYMNENILSIQRTIGESSDIVMRTIRGKKDGGRQLSIIYTDGLVLSLVRVLQKKGYGNRLIFCRAITK
ncbi:hypothetical protein [Saccharococcus caldoxylosilyticus]|uniref:Uncharacterized protein n=2 Tax=Saccharococcus caldoxylosilyticus TaxID=81408 RepID=A0A023DFD4_9BACL|nr:hypothetical protein [Parageobacillus caldoxylosilyticus]MBB3853268.1 hypothetical protein [Parageobacillus caldoxylosilyticus]BDG36056.1 hypothetical protein PcaKH15_19620 [Parageobacillus caldoxylosilyticus]BDG39839.1 hypothetical protein PcaKH16_19780 [Parageobacillus caldoxylosilyticus]BDG43609.1 hypothetical protein PcaKH35_19540 [Parageobacillus caldoxylosilyticus]GAJ39923.1 hypothetical protein GCA01S_030_00040 [Parageobacillus caldoxylosilyticus NBRC 107762]